MTIQDIPKYHLPPIIFTPNARAGGSSPSLGASGDKAAQIFEWQHADTEIDKVHWKVDTVSGTVSLTVTVGLYTVDETTTPASPDTLITGASATQAFSIGTEDQTIYAMDLGTNPTLVRGTKYAVVWNITTYTSGSILINGVDAFESPPRTLTPYSMQDVGGGGWAIDAADFLSFALETAAGTFLEMSGTFPPGNDGNADSQSSGTFHEYNVNTGSAKDEVGNILQTKASIRTSGAWLSGNMSGVGTLKLYSDPTGTPSLERSIAYDPDYRHTAGDTLVFLAWPTSSGGPFTLAVNTDYAITFLATSASAGLIALANVNTAAMLGQIPGGTGWEYCDRDGSSGAFTKNTTRRTMGLGLIINGADDGAGGGGGLLVHPGMTGGIRG